MVFMMRALDILHMLIYYLSRMCVCVCTHTLCFKEMFVCVHVCVCVFVGACVRAHVED